MARRYFLIAIFLVLKSLFLIDAASLVAEAQNSVGGLSVSDIPGGLKPVLASDPRQIDLGIIGPGEEARGEFRLQNAGSGLLVWAMEQPEGWRSLGRGDLYGSLHETPAVASIVLRYSTDGSKGRFTPDSLILELKAGEASATFVREAQPGEFLERLSFISSGGVSAVVFKISLARFSSAPLLALAPVRIDCGKVQSGEQINRMVSLVNRGKKVLKWNAGLAGRRGMPAAARPHTGRYVSFLSEATAGKGVYSPGEALRETLHLTGPWGEQNGYPSGREENATLRYRFTGTGISLLLRKSPGGGVFSLFVDEQFAGYLDGFSPRQETVEIYLGEWLPDGPHALTLVNGQGRTVLEGVRIFGRPVLKGPPGWISVFPDSGTTLRETDYVNIGVNVRGLEPGVYGERVLFLTNGGNVDVEISLEVAADAQPRLLEAYRYVAGDDYLYTTDPRAEAARLQMKGYRNQGIVFRLFSPGTPGTTALFRWFNPDRGDHFYSSEQDGGGKSLAGYLAEGTIGNIATSKLTGTRELYRWHNPKTGRHFYTTDQAGEGITKKGYRFDGIAGFVR